MPRNPSAAALARFRPLLLLDLTAFVLVCRAHRVPDGELRPHTMATDDFSLANASEAVSDGDGLLGWQAAHGEISAWGGNKPKRRCAKSGCNIDYHPQARCQCDAECRVRVPKDCCPDYVSFCKPPPLPKPTVVEVAPSSGPAKTTAVKQKAPTRRCKKSGCNTPFIKEARCQCDASCVKRSDCCPDYLTVCAATSAVAAAEGKNKGGKPKKPKRRCRKAGCNSPFVSDARCQCDQKCTGRKDCCPDYEDFCMDSVVGKDGCPKVSKPGGARPPPTDYLAQDPSCLAKLPYARLDLAAVSPSAPVLAQLWKRLTIYVYSYNDWGGDYNVVTKSSQHTWDKACEACRELFPNREPMVWPVAEDSKPVCILRKGGKGYSPILWSDFNPRRHIPNFVAYVNTGKPRKHDVKRKWQMLPGFAGDDSEYFPGRSGHVVPKSTSTCTVKWDCACKEDVSSRGHMATLSHLSFDLNAAGATNTYVNAVPARQPFDGGQWNARERENRDYTSKNGEVYVVKGPSLESDGVIQGGGSEVASMFWGAMYDPRKKEAMAWTCRNGFQQPASYTGHKGLLKVGCFCADNLAVADIEGVLGVKIYPGMPVNVTKLKTGVDSWRA